MVTDEDKIQKNNGLTHLVCKKCGHKWISRVEHPIKCPNQRCQSYKWDQSIRDMMRERMGITEEELEDELKKIIESEKGNKKGK